MNLVKAVTDLVGVNYRPLPTNARFGDGHLWQRIEEGTLEQHYNGMTFAAEAPSTSLMKTAGLILGGSLFFAGATAYHTGKTAYEAYKCSKGIWERFQLAKGQDQSVQPWDFVKTQESGIYEATLKSASQMAKSYACWIPFAMLPLPHILQPQTWMLSSLQPAGWLTDTNLGFYAGLGFVAYAIYDPRYPKVLINKMEQWIVADPRKSGPAVQKAMSSEVEERSSIPSSEQPSMIQVEPKKPGIQYRIQELFEFKVPASHYLGWSTVERIERRKKDD